MGYLQEENLISNNPKIIDYANSSFRKATFIHVIEIIVATTEEITMAIQIHSIGLSKIIVK